MNLLARILSHGFALALVALIAIALMYRGELFPEWNLPDFLVIEDQSDSVADETSGDTVPAQLDSVAVVTEEPAGDDGAVSSDTENVAPVIAADEAASSDADADSPVATAIVMPVDEATADEISVDEVVVAPLADQARSDADSSAQVTMEHEQAGDESDSSSDGAPLHDAAPEQEDEAVQTGEITGVSDDVPVEDETEQLVVPPVVDSAVEETDADVSEPAVAEEATAGAEPSQPSDSIPAPPLSEIPADSEINRSEEKTAYELLAQAREAYWLRDYENAAAAYRQLIQLEPDNPDGYGELGNLYFAQGQWDLAAAAYYDAGVRMINEDMIVQARQLVDVIRGLNGAQADELETQINAAAELTR